MANERRVGEVVYQVSMDVQKLLTGYRQVDKTMDQMEKASNKADISLSKLSKTAGYVSAALKIPAINKLSRELADLSGKIGTNSAVTEKAIQANNRMSGLFSTAASTIGAEYVSSVGYATESLIRHTKAAINATVVELKNAEAIKKEAETYQAAASQMVINANEKKKSAEESIKLAESELKVAEALAEKKTAQIESMEALHREQQYQLKQAELAHETIGNEKTLAEVIKARKAVQQTANQIDKQSTEIAQAVWAAEDKIKTAKENQAKATIELAEAATLEQKAKSTLAASNEAVATASAKVTAATKAQSLAMTGLRSTIALLGGPTGVFLLAAAGIYALYNAMNDDEAVKEYNKKIDEMIKKMDYLSSKQAEIVARALTKRIADTKEEIVKIEQTIQAYKNALDRLKTRVVYDDDDIKVINKAKMALDEHTIALREKNTALRQQEADQRRANKTAKDNEKLTNNQLDAQEIYDKVANRTIESNKLLAKTLEMGSPAAAKMELAIEALKKELDDAGIGARDAETYIDNFRNALDVENTNNFELMLQNLRENIEATRIEMEEGAKKATEYRAEMQAARYGADNKQQKKAIKLAGEQYDLQQKLNKQSKQVTPNKADEAIRKQSEELATLKKRYALLSSGVAESSKAMAVFEAVQKLGTEATQKQKDAVAKEAAEIYDLTQKVDDFIRAQEITPELKLARAFSEEAKTLQRMLTEGFIDKATFERLGREAIQSFEQGMTDIRINASVNLIEENRAKIDPIQALANENARKLEMMKEYFNQEQQLLEDAYSKQQITHEQFAAAREATDGQYLMLKKAAEEEYNRQMTDAGWELLRQQGLHYEMLTGAIDAFSGNASNALTGIITGSMSAEEAMRSLGSTILNTVVNSLVQTGVEMVKNFILGQTLGKASAAANATNAAIGGAAVLAAWTPAAIAASIATQGAASIEGLAMYQSAQLSGKALSFMNAVGRYNGGPVEEDKFYRFGENGKPEIMVADSGKQYLLPGEGGRIIPNKDLGSGSGQVNFHQENHFNITTTNGIDNESMRKLTDMMKKVALSMIKDQKRPGGLLSK